MQCDIYYKKTLQLQRINIECLLNNISISRISKFFLVWPIYQIKTACSNN